MQTIGILVAEKTDVTAKLSQSIQQVERRQSELNDMQGRLKAARERVEDLEKQKQNFSSNTQQRDVVRFKAAQNGTF